MDLGLLLLRLLLATILYMHATQKLLGWFSGPGLDTAAKIFDGLGQRPGRLMALVAVTSETAGAVLVATGFFAPLGAAIVIGTMLVAGAAMSMVKKTPWNAAGGGEYPLVLAAFAGVLAFTGPGAWSIDHATDVPWNTTSNAQHAATGVLVLVVAALASLPPLLRTRRNLARPPGASPPPATQSLTSDATRPTDNAVKT